MNSGIRMPEFKFTACEGVNKILLNRAVEKEIQKELTSGSAREPVWLRPSFRYI